MHKVTPFLWSNLIIFISSNNNGKKKVERFVGVCMCLGIHVCMYDTHPHQPPREMNDLTLYIILLTIHVSLMGSQKSPKNIYKVNAHTPPLFTIFPHDRKENGGYEKTLRIEWSVAPSLRAW